MIPLSTLTQSQLAAQFAPDDRAAAAALLEARCGDGLPLVQPEWTVLIDRIRAAVLRLSQGDLARLEHAVDTANVDWRDTLVAAGFADTLDAHTRWLPSPGTT